MFRIVTGYLAEVEDIVREGQRKGQISEGITPKAVAKFFFGMVQPAALLWHMSGGQFDIDEHIAVPWPVFMKMIGCANCCIVCTRGLVGNKACPPYPKIKSYMELMRE